MEPLLDAEVISPPLSLEAALDFRSSLIESSFKYHFTPDIKEFGLLDFVDLSKFEPTTDDFATTSSSSDKNSFVSSRATATTTTSSTSSAHETQETSIQHPSGNKSLTIVNETPLYFDKEEYSIINRDDDEMIILEDLLYTKTPSTLQEEGVFESVSKVERKSLKNHFIVVEDLSSILNVKESILPTKHVFPKQKRKLNIS